MVSRIFELWLSKTTVGYLFIYQKDCATCSYIKIVVVTCCAVQFKAYQGKILQTLAKRHAQSIKRKESPRDGQT